jgi:hypothetical protein
MSEDINAEKKKATVTRKENRAKEAASRQKASEKEKKMDSDFVYFISSNPEQVSFNIRLAGQQFKGTWDDEHEYLCWRIPHKLKDRMMSHFFVKEKRIIVGEE